MPDERAGPHLHLSKATLRRLVDSGTVKKAEAVQSPFPLLPLGGLPIYDPGAGHPDDMTEHALVERRDSEEEAVQALTWTPLDDLLVRLDIESRKDGSSP